MKPILLVEDDENDVFFMRRALQRANVSAPVHVVMDGQQAIDYLAGVGAYADRKAHPMPCLVLADLRLPKLGGLDVLRWIRANDALRTMIVIVLSSSKNERDIDEAYRAGANAFLVKPADADQLVALIEDVRDFWLKHNQPPLCC